MSTRQLSIRRGKTGDVQRFSLARPFSAATAQLLRETLSEDANEQRRSQILNDPTLCFQFACRWGGSVGLFTRPTIVTPEGGGDPLVLGSFSDTLGLSVPVSVPLVDFEGYFTTLVPRGDAEALGLSIHPTAPDVVPGPPPRRNMDPIEASMDRLNFPMPEDPQDEHRPVITALPCFLPVGPGQTFPHPVDITTDQSFRETFPLFETWLRGLHYAIDRNNGRSVTSAGPLFHQAALEVEAGIPVPFAGYEVVERISERPVMIDPVTPNFQLVTNNLEVWSDTIWAEIGGNLPPEPAPVAPGGGFGADQVRAVVEPLVNRDKVFRLSTRSQARYRILLGQAPPPDSPAPDVAVLPQLREEFMSYLSLPLGSAAADDLKELVRTALVTANAATNCLEKDVTWEAECVTLAFSDRVRTTAWVVDKLVSTPLPTAQNQLGLLQFLTPDRDALALISENDNSARQLVMANTTSSTAILDASKSSKMYCGGRLTSFRNAYESFCNLRCFLSVVVVNPDECLLVRKLREYTDILTDRHGRAFFEVYRNHPHLAIHPWQDLQHILSAFLTVSSTADLYRSVMDGNPIGMANYANAIAVADGAITELRAIVHGNGLGKFSGVPCCAPWFVSDRRSPGSSSRGGSSPPDNETKRQRLDPSDVDRKKSAGLLIFDSTAAGTNRLPNLAVYHKKRGAKTPERLCMRFMTQGFACTAKTCRYPHVSNIDILGDAERGKLIDAVKKQPGLTWAEGKAPAGTNSSP